MILPALTRFAATTGVSLSGSVVAESAVIDRKTGRDWVERELSKDQYSANDLTPLEQIGRWLSDFWDSIVAGALRANSPWLLLIVVVALAAIIALIVWRVRRVGFRRVGLPLSAFDPVVALPEPGPWREKAARSAAAGDMRNAVIDQSRAVFAVLSLKHIVTLDSSSTASELATTAEAALPEHAPHLHRVAEVFNDLLFGQTLGESAGDGPSPARGSDLGSADLGAVYAEFLRLDDALSALPDHCRNSLPDEGRDSLPGQGRSAVIS